MTEEKEKSSIKTLLNDIQDFQEKNNEKYFENELKRKQEFKVKTEKFYFELVTKITESLKDTKNICHNPFVKDPYQNIYNYVMTEFNLNFLPPEPLMEIFKNHFIIVASHQCSGAIHPLTCGIDSTHALLVGRVGFDKIPYYICPTCGYIQTFMAHLGHIRK